MHKRSGILHTIKCIHPTEPTPEVRVVKDTRAIEFHAHVIDRVMTIERREKTEWHSVAIFSEPLARVAEQYLRKGSKVYIEGQLETRKWQDQSGQDRYSTEVVLRPYTSTLTMLDGRGDNAGGGGGGSYGGGQGGGYDGGGQGGGFDGGQGGGGGYGGGSQGGGGGAPSRDLDDEIPF